MAEYFSDLWVKKKKLSFYQEILLIAQEIKIQVFSC